MKLGDLLNNLAVQSGTPADNEALKKVLSNVQVMDYDVPDEITQKISTSLLTTEAAKSNPELKKHFHAQSMNGLDKTINDSIVEFQLSDDAKAEILAETSSTKRAVLFAKKVKELEASKAGAIEGKKSELTAQINSLNTEIAALKSSTVPKSKLDEVQKSFDSRLIDRYQNDILGPKKFAADAYREDGFLLPKSKIQKALQEKNLRVVLDNDKLKLETNDGMVYFENNVAVDFDKFTDSVLAQNKYIAVSGAAASGAAKPAAASGAANDKPLSKASIMANQKLEEAMSQINIIQ